MKNKAVIFLIFLLSGLPLFSQTKTIRSLSFDFEILAQDASTQSFSQSGSVEYSSSPFTFVYKFTDPINQTFWVNPDGAFEKTGTQTKPYSQNEDVLYAICNDFLNLLNADFGFDSNYYKSISEYDAELNAVKTTWIKSPDDTNINNPRSLVAWTDQDGCIKKCESQNSQKNESTTWYFSDCFLYNGKYFAQKVIIQNKKNSKITSSVYYTFSNIKFNQPLSAQYISSSIEIQEFEQKEKTAALKKYGTATEPPLESYKTSIPQVTVGAAYKFYKTFITGQDNTNCGYSPSCSQYMLQAVSKNGLAGIFQGIDRLSRCTKEQHSSNLYTVTKDGKHYDPVP